MRTGKQFEAGKTYKVTGGGQITVTKRTAKYVTYTGDYSGKRMIEGGNIWGVSESIWVGTGNFQKLAFAAHEI